MNSFNQNKFYSMLLENIMNVFRCSIVFLLTIVICIFSGCQVSNQHKSDTDNPNASCNDVDCIGPFYDKETDISVDFLLQANTDDVIKCNLLFKNNSNESKTINLQADYHPNISITMKNGEKHRIVDYYPDIQRLPIVLRPGETTKVLIIIQKNKIRKYVNAESVSIGIDRFFLYYDESQPDKFPNLLIRLTLKLPK